jgi:hypothetical protein
MREDTPVATLIYSNGKRVKFNFSTDEQAEMRELVGPDSIGDEILKAVCLATTP